MNLEILLSAFDNIYKLTILLSPHVCVLVVYFQVSLFHNITQHRYKYECCLAILLICYDLYYLTSGKLVPKNQYTFNYKPKALSLCSFYRFLQTIRVRNNYY